MGQLRWKRPVRALAAVGTAVAAALVVGGVASGDGRGESLERPFSRAAAFTTVARTPLGLEGLTGDRAGNLYSAARGGDPCPVLRVSRTGGPVAVVGNLPAPCSPSGLAFDRAGRLYVADGDRILVLTPNAQSPPTATVFASGVPGANGVAFDRAGALWVSDGTTGQGRVWRVDRAGTPVEAFRVQPMANDVNAAGGVGGVGRDARSLPPGSVTFTPGGRSAADTAGSQPLVANGLAFARDGSLLVADTARGAIWRVQLGRDGAVRSPVGCDTTFTANTLCLDDVLVATRCSRAPTESRSTATARSSPRSTSATPWSRCCRASGASSSCSATRPTPARGCATPVRSSSRRARS
jgi:sugar lactone lactonase YvrE